MLNHFGKILKMEHRSLGFWVPFWGCLLCVILSVSLYVETRKDVISRTQAALLLHAHQAELGIEDCLERYVRELSGLASICPTADAKGEVILRRYYAANRSVFVSLLRVDKGGKLLYRVGSREERAEGGKQPSSGLLEVLGQTGSPTVSLVLDRDRKRARDLVLILVPIKIEDKCTGGLIGTCLLNHITETYLAPIRMNGRGHAALLDEHGRLLYCDHCRRIGENVLRTESFTPSLRSVVQRMLKKPSGTGRFVAGATWEDQRNLRGWLVSYYRIPIRRCNWVVAVDLPEDVALANLVGFRNKLFFLTALAILLIGFHAYLLVRTRSRLEQERSLRTVSEALEKSEIRYLDLLMKLPDGVFKMNREGRFTFVNDAMVKRCGLSGDELLGMPAWEVVVPQHREALKRAVEELVKGNYMPLHEVQGVDASGQEYWLETHVRPVNGEGGDPEFLVIARDITSHKRLEKEISESKALLQAVFDGIDDPLFVLDEQRVVRMLNKAALTYYKVTDYKTVIGKPCHAGFRNQEGPCADCEILEYLRNMRRVMFTRQLLLDGGLKHEEIFMFPLSLSATGFQGAIVHIRDITEKTLAEQQLLRSEKLAALGFLLAGVVHEINNPNSFIHFNLPILKEYLDEVFPLIDRYAESHPAYEVLGMPYVEFKSDVYRLLDNMEQGSQRINRTIATLKQFVREGSQPSFRTLDIGRIIDTAVTLCRSNLNQTVKDFGFYIEDNLPAVRSDPVAVEQIVINLLVNAAQSADKEESWVKLRVLADGMEQDRIVIEVEDNGCGIDEEVLPNIFDAFYTTKEFGTGLGLSLVHRLLEEIGGIIEVSSRKGKGSLFRVTLRDMPAEPKANGDSNPT